VDLREGRNARLAAGACHLDRLKRRIEVVGPVVPQSPFVARLVREPKEERFQGAQDRDDRALGQRHPGTDVPLLEQRPLECIGLLGPEALEVAPASMVFESVFCG
jgi:hypothetical protein